MNNEGSGVLTLMAEVVVGVVETVRDTHQRAKARWAANSVAAAARAAEKRELEQRRAWLDAVMRQQARGAARHGGMRDVRAAQRNPLDKRWF